MRKRVLVTTIGSREGGVAAMLRFVLDTLAERDFDTEVAYYKPYSESPELSVPLYKLIGGRVGAREETSVANRPAHAIGCWLPELEFTQYLPTRHWKELIDDCDFHVSVSGNCLPATGSMMCGKPHLAWVATPWHEDRKDRVAKFPLARRLLDRSINQHMLSWLECRILKHCRVLALSEYTKAELNALAGQVADVLPMPVDTTLFAPRLGAVVVGRIGFSGRFNDPRKNMPLLVRALQIARQEGMDIQLELIGDDPSPTLSRMLMEAGLGDAVRITPHLDRLRLAEHLRCLDVFVVPSHQEGLCIAALEAMASGCPVVSTRCGGPEEYVRDDQTGYCVGFDAQAMAAALCRIVRDRDLRNRLAESARAAVVSRYQADVAKAIFWRAFDSTFGLTTSVDGSGER